MRIKEKGKMRKWMMTGSKRDLTENMLMIRSVMPREM